VTRTGDAAVRSRGRVLSKSKPEWRERADELHERGGVPERRAEVVALRESGMKYAEIVDATDINYTSNVSRHLDAYREQLDDARWLAESGPNSDTL